MCISPTALSACGADPRAWYVGRRRGFRACAFSRPRCQHAEPTLAHGVLGGVGAFAHVHFPDSVVSMRSRPPRMVCCAASGLSHMCIFPTALSACGADPRAWRVGRRRAGVHGRKRTHVCDLLLQQRGLVHAAVRVDAASKIINKAREAE